MTHLSKYTPYQRWLITNFMAIFKQHKGINKFITATMLSFIAFGIIGNIFAAIIFFRHRAKWHKHHYFQFLMAAINAAMLLWEFLNRLSNYLIYELLDFFGDFRWKWPNCMLMTFYSVTLKSFSMTLLLCIAVDRLLALYTPFSYVASGLKRYWFVLGIIGIFQVTLSALRQGTIQFMQYTNNASGIRGASCTSKKDSFSFTFNRYFEDYYYFPYLGGIIPCIFLGVCNLLLAFKAHQILSNRKKLGGGNSNEGVSNKTIRSAIITGIFCAILVLCKLPHVIVRFNFRSTLTRTAPQTFFERNYFRTYIVIVFLNKTDNFFWFPETLTSFYALADARFFRKFVSRFLQKVGLKAAKELKTKSTKRTTKLET